jgi:hypothetical protein
MELWPARRELLWVELRSGIVLGEVGGMSLAVTTTCPGARGMGTGLR